MNNAEIICSEAVASGYYTKEQVEALQAVGMLPELHTYGIWKSVYGMVPKKGTKGWECRLWRRKEKKENVDNEENTEASDENRNFYLTKSFLFHISQVEKMKE